METLSSTAKAATRFHERPEAEQAKVRATRLKGRPFFRARWSWKLFTRFLRDLAPSWRAPLRITQATIRMSSKKGHRSWVQDVGCMAALSLGSTHCCGSLLWFGGVWSAWT